MKALYGPENPETAGDVIEGRLIRIGLRVLELGNNVVIDFGLWSRNERSALRRAAADLGATAELCYSRSPQRSIGGDLTSGKPRRQTRLGPCPTRNSPSGRPTSRSRRRASSTAVNPLTTHRLDSRPGTSGAITAGRYLARSWHRNQGGLAAALRELAARGRGDKLSRRRARATTQQH